MFSIRKLACILNHSPAAPLIEPSWREPQGRHRVPQAFGLHCEVIKTLSPSPPWPQPPTHVKRPTGLMMATWGEKQVPPGGKGTARARQCPWGCLGCSTLTSWGHQVPPHRWSCCLPERRSGLAVLVGPLGSWRGAWRMALEEYLVTGEDTGG